MPFSTQRAVSNGTLTQLTLSIDYFDRSEITVLFDGILSPEIDGLWAWVGTTDKKINFTPAVPNGVEVMVVRNTYLALPRHQYTGGAQFIAETLDDNFNQVLRVVQEAKEGVLLTDVFNPINMHGFPIHSLGAGTLPSDAATVAQITAGMAGTVIAQHFSGNAVLTVFSLGYVPMSEENTQVYIHGVYQQKDTYTVVGSTLTFGEAPPTGTDNIEVIIQATTPIAGGLASNIAVTPTGDVSSTNVQSAIAELAAEKATVASVAEKTATATLAGANGAAGVGFTDAQGNATTVAGLATKQIMRNDKSTPTVAGEVPGLKIGVCDGTEPGWLLNPAAGDFVVIYPYITSTAVRNRVWAMNPIVDIPSGFPATAWCYEGNLNIGTADTPDPRNTNHAIGADMVSGGTFAPSAAFATNSSTLGNRWKHGLWFDNIGGQAGSSLIKSNVNVSVDFGLDLGSATILKQGIRIGATPVAQVAAIGLRQLNNADVGLFLQRNTDTAPTGNLLQLVNAANSVVLASIDASANITTQGNIAATGGANITAGGAVQGQFFRSTAGAGTVGAGEISYGATLSNSATGGAAGALPALPQNYIIVNVAGVVGKVPFYNA